MGTRPDAQAVLADAWGRWAGRCADISAQEWATPTRCDGWDVQALVAHVCPDEAMFDQLTEAAITGPAQVSDPAELLRLFNAPGGIAHTTADDLAAQAVAEARGLTPDQAAERFARAADRLRANVLPADTVISYPAVESTTLGVITEVALMEATVHLLDLADAVGGVQPSQDALVATRGLLISVPDATAVVEVLAGRAAPERVVPAIR